MLTFRTFTFQWHENESHTKCNQECDSSMTHSVKSRREIKFVGHKLSSSQIYEIVILWFTIYEKKCDFWDFTTFTILFYNSERNRNCQKTIKTFRKRDSIIFVSDLLRVVPCVVNDKFLNLVTNNFSSQTTVWQKKEKLSQKGRRKIKFVLLLIIKIRIA